MLIALGSNLTSTAGGPAHTLSAALGGLENQGYVIRRVSRFFSTSAFPAGSGPDYVNAAAEIIADCTPAQALDRLHKVEAEMGRIRGVRWGQRTLDLDLIAAGDAVLPDAQTHAEWRDLPLKVQMTRSPDQLILPHPRMQDRAFVLVPLADIAPDWVHPILGLSVTQMLALLPKADKMAVKPIKACV